MREFEGSTDFREREKEKTVGKTEMPSRGPRPAASASRDGGASKRVGGVKKRVAVGVGGVPASAAAAAAAARPPAAHLEYGSDACASLAAWVRARGGEAHPSLRFGASPGAGLAAFASARLAAGSPLLRVPLRCCAAAPREAARWLPRWPALRGARLAHSELCDVCLALTAAEGLEAARRGRGGEQVPQGGASARVAGTPRTNQAQAAVVAGAPPLGPFWATLAAQQAGRCSYAAALPAHAAALRVATREGGAHLDAVLLDAELENGGAASRLAGSALARRIRRTAHGLLKDWRVLEGALAACPKGVAPFPGFGAAHFLEGLAVVSSRTFGVPFEAVCAADGGALLANEDAQLGRMRAEPDQCAILVPLCDMLNHRRPRMTSWALDASAAGGGADGADGGDAQDVTFLMTLLRDTADGEEVYDNYGAAGNGPLFLRFGFAVEDPFEPDHSCNDEVELTIGSFEVALRMGPPAYSFGPLAKAVDAAARDFNTRASAAAVSACVPGGEGLGEEELGEEELGEEELGEEELDALYGNDDGWEARAEAEDGVVDEDELDDEALDALYCDGGGEGDEGGEHAPGADLASEVTSLQAVEAACEAALARYTAFRGPSGFRLSPLGSRERTLQCATRGEAATLLFFSTAAAALSTRLQSASKASCARQDDLRSLPCMAREAANRYAAAYPGACKDLSCEHFEATLPALVKAYLQVRHVDLL